AVRFAVHHSRPSDSRDWSPSLGLPHTPVRRGTGQPESSETSLEAPQRPRGPVPRARPWVAPLRSRRKFGRVISLLLKPTLGRVLPCPRGSGLESPPGAACNHPASSGCFLFADRSLDNTCHLPTILATNLGVVKRRQGNSAAVGWHANLRRQHRD